MNLFLQSLQFHTWMLRVLRRFLHTARRTTIVVVFYAIVTRITRMLAFMLPLKVIILAGSDGVPRYFQFFLSPDHRYEGIIGLSVAAIVSYVLTLILDARIKTLSERGSGDVLSGATQMHVVANQRQEAQDYYETFTGLIAGILFSGLGLLLLGVLNPLLLTFVIGFVLFCFGLAAVGVYRADPTKDRPLSKLVVERTSKFLSLSSAIAFLSAFLVILYPFVTGGEGNILIAIISIILLRRMFGIITDGIKDARSLTEDRAVIDALFFPHRKLAATIAKSHRTLFDLFKTTSRRDAIAQPLTSLLETGESWQIDWLDPVLRGTAEFALTAKSENGQARHFRLRAFPSRLLHLLENENLLFAHLGRKQLFAAEIVHSYSYAGFECRVWAVADNDGPTQAEWRKLETSLLCDLWSLKPPKSLVRTYARSHTFLHQRLTDEMVARLEIAVNTSRQAGILGELRDKLPTLRKFLGEYPLAISRKRPSPGDFASSGSPPQILNWGQWTLEPMGAELSKSSLPIGQLESILHKVTLSRAGFPTHFGAHHVLLASHLARMESAIAQGQMQEGLGLAGRALQSLQRLETQDETQPAVAAGE